MLDRIHHCAFHQSTRGGQIESVCLGGDLKLEAQCGILYLTINAVLSLRLSKIAELEETLAGVFNPINH